MRNYDEVDISRVEPRGFEPLTSAVQKRHDALLELSTDSKIPAKSIISAIVYFLSFQIIYSGCCTVAAQQVSENTAKGLYCREDGGGRSQSVLIATIHEDPSYVVLRLLGVVGASIRTSRGWLRELR
jgi:hypothetical protein